MRHRLQKQLDKLKTEISTLGSFVEESVFKAVQSVVKFDDALADEVIMNDEKIDAEEVEVEERCLQVLALHQPVATDLRFVVSILKINNDLERIGDLAASIARRAKYLSTKNRLPPPFDLEDMASKTRSMLKRSLDALVAMDTDLAEKVCIDDQEVDNINRGAYQKTFEEISKEPKYAEELIHYLQISKNLERIADYATNISEDVVYMVDGVIIRHRSEDIYS